MPAVSMSPSPRGFKFISIERSTVSRFLPNELLNLSISRACRFNASSSIPPAIFKPFE